MNRVRLSILALCAALAACQAQRAPQPSAPPPSPPPARPPAPSAPVTATGDYANWPLASGDWMYREDVRGSVALYGEGGQDAKLVVRCDMPERRVYLSVPGRVAGERASLTLSTFTGARSMPLASTGGQTPYVAVSFDPADRFLDAMAHSRGRFGLEAPGLVKAAFPNWSEFVRVIENCRMPLSG